MTQFSACVSTPTVSKHHKSFEASPAMTSDFNCNQLASPQSRKSFSISALHANHDISLKSLLVSKFSKSCSRFFFFLFECTSIVSAMNSLHVLLITDRRIPLMVKQKLFSLADVIVKVIFDYKKRIKNS
jgi:hypothetical protein